MEILAGILSVGLVVGLTRIVFSDWFFGLAKAKKKPLKPAIADTDLYGIEARQKALKVRQQGNREEQKQWTITFDQLVQRLCKHKYDMHSRQWWVCTECKYEEPWYWDYECSCATYRIETYGMHEKHILTHRSGTCNLHGRDFEQYKAEALQWHIKQQKKYSKGGFTN